MDPFKLLDAIKDVKTPLALVVFGLAVVFIVVLVLLAKRRDGEDPLLNRWLSLAGILVVTCVAFGLWRWSESDTETGPVAAATAGGAGATPIKVGGAPPVPVPPAPASPLAVRLSYEGFTGAAPPMVLWHRQPLSQKEFIDNPSSGAGIAEYTGLIPLGPGKGERYEGLMHRMVTTAANEAPKPTKVCFVGTGAAPTAERMVKLQCREGEQCDVVPGEVFGQSCPVVAGKPPGGTSWLRLFPSAYAQAAPVKASSWIVPSLETLRKRQKFADGPAYTEFTLTSGPLPRLSSARTLQYEIRVNGSDVLIDGLPWQANSEPFDSAKGVNLSFGLENIGFSGADQGAEHVDVTLRFMSGAEEVARTSFQMKAVALRDQPQPVSVGATDFGLAWKARYIARAADQYQIFLISSPDAREVQRYKQRFDTKSVAVSNGRALTAVIRPPLGNSPSYGVVVGVRQPNGQVRFTFDDSASRSLCAELKRLATAESMVPHDTYRRTLDGTHQVQQCRSLAG